MKRIVTGVILAVVALVSGNALAQSPDLEGKLAYYSWEKQCVVVYSLEQGEESECVAEYSFDPDWNSDGTKLALAVGMNPEGYNIYIWDEASGELSAVTEGVHVYDRPAWSPDGEWIAFMAVEEVSKEPWVTQSRGIGQTSLKAVRVSDGEIVTLVEAHPGGRYDADARPVDTVSYTPAWSPDGMWLAFTGEAYSPVEDGAIWIPTDHVLAVLLDSYGYGVRDMTEIKPGDEWSSWEWTPQMMMPAWAPDGDRLVFSANLGEDRGFDLYVIDVGIGLPSALRLMSNAWPANPDWSPDGEWIVYSSEGYIYVVAADGSQESVEIIAGDDPSWGVE